MKNLEQIKKAIEEVKGLKKSLSFDNNRHVDANKIHVKAAASSIVEQVRKTRNAHYVLSAKDLHNIRKIRKSSTGGNPVGTNTIEQFSQARRHPDDIVDYVGVVYTESKAQAYQMLFNEQRGTVAVPTEELQPKPISEFQMSATTITFLKLAFTDVISEEALRFSETFENFLVNAAYAHLIERMTDITILFMLGSATPFNAASYNGLVPSPNVYDLVTFMINQYNSSSVNADASGRYVRRNADLVILNSRRMASVKLLKDTANRYQFQPVPREQMWSTNVLEYSQIRNFTGTPITLDDILVLNTSDVRLIVHNDIEVYVDRIVDGSADRNAYRLTAEVFFLPVLQYRDANSSYIIRSNPANDLPLL